MISSKKEQRIQAINARRALTSEQRADFSCRLCDNIAQLKEYKDAKVILAYAATWDEVDPAKLCKLAEEQGKTVAFPVSYKGGIMEAYAPKSVDDLKEGLLGIKAPDKEQSRLVLPQEIDLVLVPCVAFDEEKRRLGHGGGYYDRYLPECTNAKFVLIAFEAQKILQIATEKHDILMDLLVTEQKVY